MQAVKGLFFSPDFGQQIAERDDRLAEVVLSQEYSALGGGGVTL